MMMSSNERRNVRGGRRAAIFAVLSLFSSILLVGPIGIVPAGADGGDVQSINFAAEDPEEYDHATGGGFFGSDTDGDGKETVESLQGGDFACGDIVTYFVELVVQGDGSDDPQTIQITNTFLADATGQTGAGLTDVVNVLIDPADPAQSNDGGSTIVVIDEGIDANGAAPYANDGMKLAGGADSTYVTYTVDDLETGEVIIVRIDVQLECAPNTSPTGNMQGNLTEADIVAVNGGTPVDPPDAVAGGNQTIPFQQIGQLVGAGEPTLDIQKTVMAAGGTCGVDDVESLDITQGDSVTYCYLVTNDGTADLTDLEIVDDNGTPADTADDFTVVTGATVGSVTSVYFTADVTIANAGTTTNTATADGSGPQNLSLNDSDTATVEAAIGLNPPALTVVKTAGDALDGETFFVDEPGANVTFTVAITNTGGEATISSFGDNVHLTESCVDSNGADVVGQTIAENETITCTFSGTVIGNTGDSEINTVTVNATNVAGSDVASDDAVVEIADVAPVPLSIVKSATGATTLAEPGGDFNFRVVVTNNSTVDSATVTDLDDTYLADLQTAGCSDADGNTVAPFELSPGEALTCDFTVPHSDIGSYTNTVTVTATDDDGASVGGDSNPVTVEVTDVPSSIVVTKSANPTSVPETGGDVTYTVVVENTSAVDTVTINSVVDDQFGDVSASCLPVLPADLAVGESLSCSFTETISGDAGTSHVNVATATGVDDDGGPVTGDGDAEVPFTDVLPDVSITKTANPTSVPETGADVEFTIVVTNNSLEDATIDSLTDSDFDLSTRCADAVGTVLASGATYSCSFSETLSGDASGPDHENTATVVASDDDGNADTASDDAQVIFDDVLPDVSITKTANPTSVPEPGADVEFTIVVTNNSLEDATIDAVGDSDFPDAIASDCDDAAGTVLASGATYECSFTVFVEGNPADGSHMNTAMVKASDNDGNIDMEMDDETVTITDVAPVIAVTKTPSQQEVFAPGEDVTFAIEVTNNSVSTDPVTINSISDDVFGDLTGECGLPVTVAPDGSFTCEITRSISADHTNTVSVAGVDDENTPATGQATASVEVSNPSISIEKSTNGFNADSAPGPEILVGSDVTWTYEVTNDGDVAMSNIAVSDDQGVVVDCGGVTTLAAGESVTCTASGTSAAGQYTNVGSVSASYTDADGDVADRADSDTSNYFGADPEVGITKTFADDSVIAGGTASSFDLVVSNDGNVDLSGVSVTDTVDADLVVASVSSATADCANSAGQVIDCVVDLAVGESATVTVTFAVDSVTVETLGVSNTADATNTYTDDSANSVDLADDDTDTIDILTDINLSIVKTFDPNDVPQGTLQTFTLEVSNAGPSDAVDVSVSDVVDDTLAVQGASVTSGAGDCAASAGQTVDCTVQVPAGESVTVTVSYLVAPFLGDDGSTTGGDTFRFVFANGDVLEGSTATGEVLLNGVDVSAQTTIISGLSRNDVVFDPDGPGGEPAIELHLSCSDAFTGGYGTSGGPVEGVNSPDYQIAFFSIARYNNNGFIKDCGNVTNPFDVDNTAEATGVDSFGTDTVSDTATVTVSPGITLDRLQTAGKRLTVRLTNLTSVDKSIESISVLWPDSNGDLRKIRLDDATTWTGNEAPTSAVLDAADAGWVGGTLMTGEGILRLDFGRKVAKNGYTVRVTFEDGTFLDISK